MSLVTWEKVCRPHKDGGLCIQHLEGVQSACLAKHLAKFFDGSSSLWARMIKFKYKIPTSVWDLKQSRTISWI